MPLIPNNTETEQLVTIELPVAGEWVKVKPRLSRGDEIAIQKAAVRDATLVDGKPQIDVAWAIEAGEFAALDVAIKVWSFDVPVSPEAIRQLDPASVDAIKAKLDELYPPTRTDDDRKNSPSVGVTPSSDGVLSLTNSVGSH